MTGLLFRSSFRHLTRHPWQSFLSVLGVALGVGMVVAVDLAIDSSRRAFELSTDAVVGRTTDWITGGPSGVPDATYTKLRVEAGCTNIAPVVEGYAVLESNNSAPDSAGSTGSTAPAPAESTPAATTRLLHLLGIDPIADRAFRPFLAPASAAGTPASANLQGPQLVDLITEPNTALLSAASATRAGLHPGSRFTVRVSGRRYPLTLVGVIRPTDERSRQALDSLLITDIATAQDLLAQPGRLDRIDVILPPASAATSAAASVSASANDPREAIGRLLPPGVFLQPSTARGDAIRQMTAAFQLNLTALSLLALVCGMFLIYNAMTFSVIQRRQLIGTVRALGVTRGQIFALVFREALIIAVAGSALGLLFGLVLGMGLVKLVVQTINDLYFVLELSHLTLAPWTFIKGALLGIGGTGLAALAPAYEATRGPARATMARSAIESHWRKLVPRAAVLGGLLACLSIGLMLFSGANLFLNFAALLCVILACALFTPLATVILMVPARAVMGRCFGLIGRMAARGVTTTLSRTAVAVAALMVAIAVTIAVGVMIGSFRITVDRWLTHTLLADVYISPPRLIASRIEGTLDPSLEARFAAIPGVAWVNLYHGVDVPSPDGPVHLIGMRLDPRSYRAFTLQSGNPATAWPAFQDGAAIFVTEAFAYHHQLAVGAPFTLNTDHGPRSFPIAAIYIDYSSDRGGILMSRKTYLENWDDPAFNSLGLYAAPDADPAAVLAAAEASARALGADREPLVQSNRQLRNVSMDIFERTFLITDVLRFVATAVAFVGVLSALMALQMERTRELGILRATGMTPGQVWRLILMQTGLMGIAAGLFALPTGLMLAQLMISVINRRSFGWSLQMQIDPWLLLQALGLAVGAALLAGLFPALKMSRISAAAALRDE